MAATCWRGVVAASLSSFASGMGTYLHFLHFAEVVFRFFGLRFLRERQARRTADASNPLAHRPPSALNLHVVATCDCHTYL
jgi:hypothetical protein